MVLFDETGIIYVVMNNFTTNVTGSLFLTLLLILAFFILLALAFRIPIELTAIIVFPLLIGLGAVGGSTFMPVLGVGIIYLSLLLAKNFFFWR